MSKFKIEKGISRINRVKLQATIEESIAADLGLLGEWSNNDKNYIVNELLRFALCAFTGQGVPGLQRVHRQPGDTPTNAARSAKIAMLTRSDSPSDAHATSADLKT